MNRLAMGYVLLLSLAGVDLSAATEVVDASVCEVLADPSSLSGKTVRLRGATVVAGFDKFLIEGTGCKPAAAIWVAYPEGTKGNAGPAAFVRLQLAKNSAAVVDAPKVTSVTLQRNGDFERFDSLLATPYNSSPTCLACPRYKVTASLVGRLDGASTSGVVRDNNGNVIGLAGFGNLNQYRARLVLQAVADVVPHEIDYSTSTTAVSGYSRSVPGRAAADAVRRAGAAFGAPGEDNGVIVSFGVANEVAPTEGGKGDVASPDGILFHVMLDMKRLGKELLPRALAHVGTHIADVRDRRVQNVSEAETRAWQVTFSHNR